MRLLISLFFLYAVSLPALGQALEADFIHGRDYTFERAEAKRRVHDAGKRAKAPSIWIYAARDPFYNESAPRDFLRAWRDAGGAAEYFFVSEHSLPSGEHIPRCHQAQASAPPI